MEPILRHEILADSTTSPLGQVTLSARIENGRGVMPPFPYRTYGSYAIVYITKGEGNYQDANGYSQQVREGDAIVVFPDLPHTYGPRAGGRWSELYLVFQGPVFDTCRAQGILDPHRPLHHLSPMPYWVKRLEDAAAVPSRPSTSAKARQVCELLVLLTDIALAAGDAPVESQKSSWASDACHLLAQDLDTPLTAAEVVKRSGQSYEIFRRNFTATLGITPVQYRANRRMEVACHMLQYTSMTNAQIAENLAFTDEYYFSKRFKMMHGISPKQFRKNVAG